MKMIPHTCPVCGGQGTVSKPPWIAGDQNEWVSGTLEPYSCKACAGAGIVWEKEKKDEEGGCDRIRER